VVRQVGGYRLERVVGEGATGVVYAARGDAGLVAVKMLRPEYAGEDVVRARFVREARLAAGIKTPHVVPILELGEVDDLTYLVMPFLSGGSLADRLRAMGQLSVGETVALAAQLGRGLDALHEARILHRDVKPSNVLLDGDGSAALSDFGLARGAESTRLTSEGQLLGSLHYIAPELIEGAAATAASDVYALGCLLYECLVGAPPFAGRSPAEIGFAHLAEPPPDPRQARAGVQDEIAAALAAALEKDPAARPTTGTALARMLHVARNAQPL
jgi:serine/threonine-protein kinase